MTLTVVSFKWGNKYSADYVLRQASAVKRNLTLPHHYVCITDNPAGLNEVECWPIENVDLLKVKDGCYCRLRMFDPEWQQRYKIERIVCLDLDLVIVANVDPLFGRTDDVVLLRGGHFNPCIYNGSVQMIRAGAHPGVWQSFDVGIAEKVATASGHHLGTDQTWLEHMLPNAAFWTDKDGIFGYEKPGWPMGVGLPAHAKIVAFPGHRDPSRFLHLDWVKKNWR